jgi:hypothetical protein
MKKAIITICFFFFLNSYAQQKEYKIEIFPISEIDSIKLDSIEKSCFYLSLTRGQGSIFGLYYCGEKQLNIYTSWLQDTLIVDYLVFYHFYITDTLSYYSVNRIDRYSKEKIVFNRKREIELVKEILFQKEKELAIYYQGILAYNDVPISMTFTFIPTLNKTKRRNAFQKTP